MLTAQLDEPCYASSAGVARSPGTKPKSAWPGSADLRRMLVADAGGCGAASVAAAPAAAAQLAELRVQLELGQAQNLRA